MIKILVIGNGFDKAHGLKTGYADFLDWYNIVSSAYMDASQVVSSSIMLTGEERNLIREFQRHNPDEYEETINARNNFWITYFIKRKDELGANWLDFEKEIEIFVKRIYAFSKENPIRKVKYEIKKECGKELEVPAFVNYEDFFEWLSTELRMLTRVLEIYLCKYVNKSIDRKNRIKLFTEIKPNKLISFNYTSTYQDIYNNAIQNDYIHGKARMSHTMEDCPLVLGFDDHYFESSDTIREWVPFEKYYQRIVFRNSNNYFSWIDSQRESGDPEEKEVYFYGHSMSPADGDILKLLLEAKNTRSIIYYRKEHEEERANMIKNLAVILTPNGLISRVGGRKPTIEFVPI